MAARDGREQRVGLRVSSDLVWLNLALELFVAYQSCMSTEPSLYHGREEPTSSWSLFQRPCGS